MIPAKTQTALQKLKTHTPDQNDRSVLNSVQKVLGPVVREEMRYGAHGPYTVVAKITKPRGLSEQQLAQCKAYVLASLTPAQPEDLKASLLRLKALTAGRQQTGEQMAVEVTFYVEELLKYPADVALKALQGRWQWFPSCAELLESCDVHMGVRRSLKAALDQWTPWTDADEIEALKSDQDRLRAENTFNPSEANRQRIDEIDARIIALGGSAIVKPEHACQKLKPIFQRMEEAS